LRVGNQSCVCGVFATTSANCPDCFHTAVYPQPERHQYLQNEKDSRTAMLPTRASPENSMPGSFLYSTHAHTDVGLPVNHKSLGPSQYLIPHAPTSPWGVPVGRRLTGLSLWTLTNARQHVDVSAAYLPSLPGAKTFKQDSSLVASTLALAYLEYCRVDRAESGLSLLTFLLRHRIPSSAPFVPHSPSFDRPGDDKCC
jgi:hypothetical protein